MAGRSCGESLAGPRLTVAAVRKWLCVSQATVSLVHSLEVCLRPARLEEVAGGVPALHPGGVHGGGRLVTDQAALLGARGGAVAEGDELPFFSSLWAA